MVRFGLPRSLIVALALICFNPVLQTSQDIDLLSSTVIDVLSFSEALCVVFFAYLPSAGFKVKVIGCTSASINSKLLARTKLQQWTQDLDGVELFAGEMAWSKYGREHLGLRIASASDLVM